MHARSKRRSSRIELSRRYPGLEGKDQILEWYLNTISYGTVAYGIEAAAEHYFGKDAEELTLAEAAMLVPSRNTRLLNPIDNFAEAKKRQEIVLDQMYLQGYITAEEAWEAKQEKLTIVSKPFDIQAPHFVMYVRQLLEERYGLEMVYGKGLRVYTTLDLDMQDEAERIAREHIATIREEHNATNAAVVVHRTRTTARSGPWWAAWTISIADIDGQVNMATLAAPARLVLQALHLCHGLFAGLYPGHHGAWMCAPAFPIRPTRPMCRRTMTGSTTARSRCAGRWPALTTSRQ